MGNCPCCPKRGNYNPYIDDDEYIEYDSSHTGDASRYKPLTATNYSSTEETGHYSHTNRPPDGSSSYSPPPLPPSRGNSIPTQRSSGSSQPYSSTPPTHSATPPRQQYTQYTESAYLSRHTGEPTDSMLLDSMMKSSFMDRPQSTHTYSQHSTGTSGAFDEEDGSSLVDSGAFASSQQTSSQVHDANASPRSSSHGMTASDASIAASTMSSVYYDAPGTSSYMMGSVNEGAFEVGDEEGQR